METVILFEQQKLLKEVSILLKSSTYRYSFYRGANLINNTHILERSGKA